MTVSQGVLLALTDATIVVALILSTRRLIHYARELRDMERMARWSDEIARSDDGNGGAP
jgi:hypothetical protein